MFTSNEFGVCHIFVWSAPQIGASSLWTDPLVRWDAGMISTGVAKASSNAGHVIPLIWPQDIPLRADRMSDRTSWTVYLNDGLYLRRWLAYLHFDVGLCTIFYYVLCGEDAKCQRANCQLRIPIPSILPSRLGIRLAWAHNIELTATTYVASSSIFCRNWYKLIQKKTSDC